MRHEGNREIEKKARISGPFATGRDGTAECLSIHEIGERWIANFERGRLQALSDMKKALEEGTGE